MSRVALLRPSFKAVLSAISILLFASAPYAQTSLPSVTASPPAITFAPWRQVDQTEEGTEFVEEFPSSITTAYAANNTVQLRVFVPAKAHGPMPVVLVFHYWGAADIRSERALAQDLNRSNIAAAVMILPYHMSRTPPGYHSGEIAIRSDPKSMLVTMTQAVMDAKRSMDFLDTRDELLHTGYGIAGTSLGSLVAELTYAVDDRISKAAFVLGGVDLARIVWESSLLVRQRDALRRRGYTEQKLRDEIAPIEPLKYLPMRKPVASFVIGGQYDTVIPKVSTDELIESLTAPSVLWLDTGHYGGIFVQHRLMREVSKFFTAEFIGTTFVAPKQLYAPTIRIGVKADTGNGFDLGIGVDLLKFDKKGDTFTTLFITPRGPQLFLGRTVFSGISVGVFGSTRTAGIGLLWSAVL